MTQATDSHVLNRLDKLTAAVESLAQGLQETKLKTRVFHAQTTEKLVAMYQRLDRIEKRLDAQEGRFWTLIGLTLTALLGILGKLAFWWC